MLSDGELSVEVTMGANPRPGPEVSWRRKSDELSTVVMEEVEAMLTNWASGSNRLILPKKFAAMNVRIAKLTRGARECGLRHMAVECVVGVGQADFAGHVEVVEVWGVPCLSSSEGMAGESEMTAESVVMVGDGEISAEVTASANTRSDSEIPWRRDDGELAAVVMEEAEVTSTIWASGSARIMLPNKFAAMKVRIETLTREVRESVLRPKAASECAGHVGWQPFLSSIEGVA